MTTVNTYSCPICGGDAHWDHDIGEPVCNDPSRHEPPVIRCSCGKVLENPRMYAAHCAEFPDHFTST